MVELSDDRGHRLLPRPGREPAELLAVEALVRWHHPTRGLPHPPEFGPVLERSRVHARYVDWLLGQALGLRSMWVDRDLPVAVNIAAQCVLDLGFPDQVAAALEWAKVSGGQLILDSRPRRPTG